MSNDSIKSASDSKTSWLRRKIAEPLWHSIVGVLYAIAGLVVGAVLQLSALIVSFVCLMGWTLCCTSIAAMLNKEIRNYWLKSWQCFCDVLLSFPPGITLSVFAVKTGLEKGSHGESFLSYLKELWNNCDRPMWEWVWRASSAPLKVVKNEETPKSNEGDNQFKPNSNEPLKNHGITPQSVIPTQPVIPAKAGIYSQDNQTSVPISQKTPEQKDSSLLVTGQNTKKTISENKKNPKGTLVPVTNLNPNSQNMPTVSNANPVSSDNQTLSQPTKVGDFTKNEEKQQPKPVTTTTSNKPHPPENSRDKSVKVVGNESEKDKKKEENNIVNESISLKKQPKPPPPKVQNKLEDKNEEKKKEIIHSSQSSNLPPETQSTVKTHLHIQLQPMNQSKQSNNSKYVVSPGTETYSAVVQKGNNSTKSKVKGAEKKEETREQTALVSKHHFLKKGEGNGGVGVRKSGVNKQPLELNESSDEQKNDQRPSSTSPKRKSGLYSSDNSLPGNKSPRIRQNIQNTEKAVKKNQEEKKQQVAPHAQSHVRKSGSTKLPPEGELLSPT